MESFRSIERFRDALAERRRAGGRVGFVPTMGYLHEGHLELVREAGRRADLVVVSIFVNPTQFGPDEDLKTYPRDLPLDLEACRREGADLVFAPEVTEMYPPEPMTTVRVQGMTAHLCGASRPTHFEGVTTVVAKLFNIVQPDVAVFGMKDYQQVAVLRCMVRELHFPIEIVSVPTVREPDGLAMSSRNAYLSKGERSDAVELRRGLVAARDAADRGERSVQRLRKVALQRIESVDTAQVDYLEVVHPTTLAVLEELGEDGGVMAAAVFVGRTRLLDNIHLLLGTETLEATT